MSGSTGSSDESIGRPAEWREGRYQQPDRSVDKTVDEAPSAEHGAPDVPSTPVTRKDYESLETPADKADDNGHD